MNGTHWGAVEAHHAGVKPGVGLKADDRTSIPLCHKHHRELEDKSGKFRGRTKSMMREWEDARIAETQAAWEDEHHTPGPVARLLDSDQYGRVIHKKVEADSGTLPSNLTRKEVENLETRDAVWALSLQRDGDQLLDDMQKVDMKEKWEKAMGELTQPAPDQRKEAVEHPAHYNIPGATEVIQVICEQGFGEGFCLGNALKYICRAKHKGRYDEDLKKASFYMNYWLEWLKTHTP
jgi:hypothetical protein